MECLELYTRRDEEHLRARISDGAYYRNFVSLAQTIEPDGRNIELVGFPAVRSGAPKQVQLTHTPPAVPVFRDEAQRRTPEHEKLDELTVEVTGTLKFADVQKTTNEIQIVSAGNVRHPIVVPEGMMSDVVNPLWRRRSQ